MQGSWTDSLLVLLDTQRRYGLRLAMNVVASRCTVDQCAGSSGIVSARNCALSKQSLSLSPLFTSVNHSFFFMCSREWQPLLKVHRSCDSNCYSTPLLTKSLRWPSFKIILYGRSIQHVDYPYRSFPVQVRGSRWGCPRCTFYQKTIDADELNYER